MPQNNDYLGNAIAVTPNDGTDLAAQSKLIIAGAAGTIAVITAGNQAVTVTAAAGIPIPLRVTRIKATGTTATGITVLY